MCLCYNNKQEKIFQVTALRVIAPEISLMAFFYHLKNKISSWLKMAL